MRTHMLIKIKSALRIKHTALDEDILSDIEACLKDLEVCGITHADLDADPLIFNAVKLYCRSLYTDDPAKGAEYLRRYEALKGSLQMASGYGREANKEDE